MKNSFMPWDKSHVDYGMICLETTGSKKKKFYNSDMIDCPLNCLHC